jgi:hypothetical protein
MASYFSFAVQFYKQITGVAMGSPLSLVIINFFIEDFEKKPLCWFRYMDNTFVIWPLGPDRLRDFLDHLMSVN